MLSKDMQASDEMFNDSNDFDEWTNKIVTWSLSLAILGLILLGMLINFFLV